MAYFQQTVFLYHYPICLSEPQHEPPRLPVLLHLPPLTTFICMYTFLRFAASDDFSARLQLRRNKFELCFASAHITLPQL